MRLSNPDSIRQRLQKELATIQKTAIVCSGPERAALETLARIFQQRLAEVPMERRPTPPRVKDVLPPVHPFMAQ